MEKLCIKYSKDKTKLDAMNSVDNCKSIILNNYASYKVLQKLCGAISYSSLFIIDEFALVSGKSYTAENVCYFSNGIFKESTHLLIENCMKITVQDYDIDELLYPILSDCLFGEVVTQFELNPKDIYCMLAICYYTIISCFSKVTAILEMWKNPQHTIHSIQNWFIVEEGVI